MSGLSERDVRLANLICADTDEPMWSAVVITKHILASDWLAEHDAAIRAEAKAEALALRTAIAEVVRDHNMPPNKDQHGYDYRMGWWDAIAHADRHIRKRVREWYGQPCVHVSSPQPGTLADPQCTCGGMAACPPCQERDAAQAEAEELRRQS